jgi:hypothetical protein
MTGSESEIPNYYFEIYSLAVEMADRISSRRVVANSFFASINTGLIVLLGSQELDWYVALAGVILALVWWALLKSYRDLNSAKFKIINGMEERLPVKIFSEEWAMLKRDPEAVPAVIGRTRVRGWLAQYRELGAVERIVPWMFATIFIVNITSQVNWPDRWVFWG